MADLAGLFFLSLIVKSHCSASELTSTYRCINSTTHKNFPSNEHKLFKQCAVYRDLSCCSEETSVRIHSLNITDKSLYNFNYNQCPDRILSEKCKQFFIHDLCFYQCSPYNMPWIIYAPMKIRNEKLHKVPLCQSDCNAWFEACQYDYTCSDNWSRNFIWDKEGNKCLDAIPCSTFGDIYVSANNFCEKIWDDSWEVVPDSTPCMRLQLKTVNHNRVVAFGYANQQHLYRSEGMQTISSTLLLTLTAILKLLIIYNY